MGDRCEGHVVDARDEAAAASLGDAKEGKGVNGLGAAAGGEADGAGGKARGKAGANEDEEAQAYATFAATSDGGSLHPAAQDAALEVLIYLSIYLSVCMYISIHIYSDR